MKRRHAQRGSIPIEFAAGIGLLVLPMALLVLQIPRWLDRVHLAEGVALESARLCARADSMAEGQAAATAYAAGTPNVVSVTCTSSAGDVVPGAQMQAAVAIQIPAITLPVIGVDTGTFTVTRRHTERVDQYRSFGP